MKDCWSTLETISGAAESSTDRMRQSPTSGFVFPSAVQVNKANTRSIYCSIQARWPVLIQEECVHIDCACFQPGNICIDNIKYTYSIYIKSPFWQIWWKTTWVVRGFDNTRPWTVSKRRPSWVMVIIDMIHMFSWDIELVKIKTVC